MASAPAPGAVGLPGAAAPRIDWHAEIERAAARLEGQRERQGAFVRETPLWKLSPEVFGLPATLAASGVEIWLKLEHLQAGGSFKARGMMNRLLAGALPASGVIVASGGNAGIATAAAARALGVPCEVFVPGLSPEAKRERLRALGARVTVAGDAYADALAACLARQRESGALLTHAYDQVEVVAGAGTLGREIEAQGGLPDSVLVSVGGGGLVGGLAAWFAGRSRVVALEPERAPTLFRAREAGMPVDVEVGGIAADSLGARRIGALSWDIVQQHLHEALLLDDAAIRAAQSWLWRELKLAVEPAAALPLAALQTGAYVPRPGEKICLIVCGANVDPATLG